MKKNVYLSIRENKEISLIKIFRNMKLIVSTKTKKIEKGTIIVQEFLDDENSKKSYEVTTIIKNSPINTQLVCKYLADYIFENFEKLAEGIQVL